MSTDFTQTKTQLIYDAFQRLGVYGIGRTVSAEDISYASNVLNKMVKAWAAEGLHLFAKEEGVLYLVPGASNYLLGSTAKVTLASDEVLTILDGEHLSGISSLTVASTSGMTVADNIGIVLSDGTIHWTTIATISGATSLTINLALTSDASDEALVFTYTNNIEKPLRVLSARKRTGYGTNIIDLPLGPVGYQDYQNFPVKNVGTSPTQYNYKPQNTYGTFYLWPCPSTGAERVHFTYERILTDLDNASDNFDFPPEWLEPIEWQLAIRLARPFGKATALQDLVPMASAMLDNLKAFDSEKSGIQMMPEVG